MPAVLSFVQQVRRRLLRHAQLNIVGFFGPLAICSWALSRLVLGLFSAPLLLALLPPIVCGGLFGLALWKLRTTLDFTAVASLLDDALAGKERFLTLVTAGPSDSADALSSLIQTQTEQLAASFRPERDLVLTIDKRAPWALECCAGQYAFACLLAEPGAEHPVCLLVVNSSETSSRSQEEAIATLEEAARRLLAPTATPQEQMTGAQLLSLVQQLKDPSLTPQEKQQHLADAQKRLSLNSPMPQIFPLDLKIFAGKGKDDKGQGNDKDTSQSGNTPLEKAGDNPGQSKQSSSSTGAGNEPQPGGSPQDGEKQKQPQPRQDGGSLAFHFPQPEGKTPGQSPQESSSATSQKPAQPQTPDSRTPGADPNRPGAGQNNQTQNTQGKDPTKPDPQQEQKNEKGEGRTNVGMGKGERVLKPEAQAGGGFLTKDARFVKVRVPVGQEAQAEEDGRTANSQRTTPKTPYSNAPLKEGRPDQAQLKQPIPLEYRAILTE